MAGDDANTPKDFNECVSQGQLQAVIDNAQKDMKEAVTKAITDAIIELKLGEIVERVDKRVSTLTDRVAALETRQPTNEDDASNIGGHPEDVVYNAHGNVNQAATRQAWLRRRLRTNTIGMCGGAPGSHTCAPDDPYAKIKFTIPSFSRHYDAEGYLDWEMTIDQKFSAHLVPEQCRVRQATSEFKDFAIIWWTGLAADGSTPSIWEELKVAMRDRFTILS